MSGTLRLRGATSGYSELQAPAVAADQTFILPTDGGTLLTTDSPISKLTLELGSASQPSLTFEGDTDTGLYSSGTNTLNLVTGGNNRLNIASGGSVGINTTNPGHLLDVNGSLGVTGTSIFDDTLQVGGDAQVGQAGLQIFDGGNITIRNDFASNDVFRVLVTGSSTYNIALKASGDASFLGKVGIGTTSPAQNLDVASSSNIAYALDGWALAGKGDSSDILFGGILGSQFDTLKLFTSGSERMRIDSSGRVGIGVSPSTFNGNGDNLVISSGGDTGITIDATSGTNSSIHFADGPTGTEAYRGYIVYRHNGDSMAFGTSADERMRIDSSGFVGINTSSPQRLLHIHGGAQTGLKITGNNTGSGASDGFDIFSRDDTNGIEFFQRENAEMRFSTNATERMRILSTGGLTFNGDTAQANALDDYEEGTWTPVINKAGTTGSITSYTSRWGVYRKVGSLLYISFYVYVVSGTFGTGSSQWYVSGLPYSLLTLAPSAYQFIPTGYMGLNGSSYNFPIGSGNGTADGGRWQSNSVNGADTLSLYGIPMAINWSSGGLEMSGSGALMTT